MLLATRSGLEKPIARSRGWRTRHLTLSASVLASRDLPETTVAAVIGEALRATAVQKILLDTPVLGGSEGHNNLIGMNLGDGARLSEQPRETF